MAESGTFLLRLPPLHGGWLVAFRVCWCAVALLALITLALSYRAEVAQQRLELAFLSLGLRHAPEVSDRWPIILPTSAAAKRFVHGPETLLSIGGQPVPADLRGGIGEIKLPPEKDVPVILGRADGTQHRIMLRRSNRQVDEYYARSGLTFKMQRWIQYAAHLVAALALIGASSVLFFKRPRDPVAALLAMGMTAHMADPTVLGGAAFLPMADILLMVSNILGLWGIIAFPDGQIRSRFALATMIIVPVTTVLTKWIEFMRPGAVTLDVLLIILTCIMVVVSVLTNYQSYPAGRAKQQIKYALLGFASGMVTYVAGTIVLGVEPLIDLPWLRPWLALLHAVLTALSFVMLAGGLLISLLRYRLYDAETAISRSVAYGTLTLALLAIFTGTQKIIEAVGVEHFGHNMGALAAGIGAGLAAILITPLHHRIGSWAERHFQSPLVHLRHGLPVVLGDVRETATPTELAGITLSHMEGGVRASRGAVVTGSEILATRAVEAEAVREWLMKHDMSAGHLEGLQWDRSDPLFPMRVPLHASHTGLVGWILLGSRPDGSFYGKDERETLLAIAEPTARALAVVIERQRRESSRLEEMDALRRVVAELREFVARHFSKHGASV